MKTISAYGLGSTILHIASRKLLLFQLLWNKSCRGISLITQEMLLVMYLSRYMDMLYLFESITVESIKILHLAVSLAVVLIIRYNTRVAESYDADLDTVPRALMVIPPLVLALIFNKVMLIIEILHMFSFYLEAIVLVPQFVLLYRRQKYEKWVIFFTVLLGAESLVRNLPKLIDWKEQNGSNLYGLLAALVQAIVFLTGLVVLALRALETRKQQGLNEVINKPAFDEVWEAGKFEFTENSASTTSLAASPGQFKAGEQTLIFAKSAMGASQRV